MILCKNIEYKYQNRSSYTQTVEDKYKKRPTVEYKDKNHSSDTRAVEYEYRKRLSDTQLVE